MARVRRCKNSITSPDDLNYRFIEDVINDVADPHIADSVPDASASVEPLVIHEELKERIQQVLNNLTFREREIMKLRYGLTDGCRYSLSELARKFKVTRERVRQIEAKSMRKLQHPRRSAQLEGFL